MQIAFFFFDSDKKKLRSELQRVEQEMRVGLSKTLPRIKHIRNNLRTDARTRFS